MREKYLIILGFPFVLLKWYGYFELYIDICKSLIRQGISLFQFFGDVQKFVINFFFFSLPVNVVFPMGRRGKPLLINAYICVIFCIDRVIKRT